VERVLARSPRLVVILGTAESRLRLTGEFLRPKQLVVGKGLMGVFENARVFAAGTMESGEAGLRRATAAGAISIVGGGDSVAAAHQFSGVADKISQHFDGRRSVAEFLGDVSLPGVSEALTNMFYVVYVFLFLQKDAG